VISSSDLTPGGLTGRAAETAAIRRALARSRLVTVTGLPGVGKTATAITAAMGVNGSFADGVALIRLDTLQDEALLPHTIAAAMLLPDTFGASPLSALTRQLEGKHMLLVFDTCEHLLGACAATASAVTEQCPGIRVLATSREPLRVPGEDTMAIPPLPVRDAVRLLGQRSGQHPRHPVTEPGTDSVSEATARAVCERLDGLPLALGMAARQLTLGSLDMLLIKLDGGYDFLSDPDNPIARHRTLHAAIGWSHQLCTPSERLLWARLSVFDGPFSVKDCLEVCVTTHLSEETITVGVAMLAERSLLLREGGEREGGEREGGEREGGERENGECDGELRENREREGAPRENRQREDRQREIGEPPRYVMPRVIRAYGLSMLRRLAEDEEMRRKYRRWRSGPRRDEAWT
jgi:predicted ATPase